MEMTARSQRFCCPYLSKNLQGKDKWRTKAWLASPVMPKHPHGLTPAAWLQTGLQACGAPSQQLRLPAGAPGLCHAREMPRAGRRAQHPCAFLTVSISVASVWVAPVTVHMFAGCRCAEGYLHTRWCCKSRGFSRPSPVPVPAVLAMPMGTTADWGDVGYPIPQRFLWHIFHHSFSSFSIMITSKSSLFWISRVRPLSTCDHSSRGTLSKITKLSWTRQGEKRMWLHWHSCMPTLCKTHTRVCVVWSLFKLITIITFCSLSKASYRDCPARK